MRRPPRSMLLACCSPAARPLLPLAGGPRAACHPARQPTSSTTACLPPPHRPLRRHDHRRPPHHAAGRLHDVQGAPWLAGRLPAWLAPGPWAGRGWGAALAASASAPLAAGGLPPPPSPACLPAGRGAGHHSLRHCQDEGQVGCACWLATARRTVPAPLAARLLSTRPRHRRAARSVLMLASFEKTTDHLFDAALHGRCDDINGAGGRGARGRGGSVRRGSRVGEARCTAPRVGARCALPAVPSLTPAAPPCLPPLLPCLPLQACPSPSSWGSPCPPARACSRSCSARSWRPPRCAPARRRCSRSRRRRCGAPAWLPLLAHLSSLPACRPLAPTRVDPDSHPPHCHMLPPFSDALRARLPASCESSADPRAAAAARVSS